jgi:hypothetical protein
MKSRASSGFAKAFLAGMLLAFACLPGARRPTQPNRNVSPLQSAAANKMSAPRSDYIGDAACAQCHQAIVDAYDKTAHHLTSQPATQNAILGSFRPDANNMPTSNPNLHFRMDSKEGQFFQTAVWGTPPEQRRHTERFDLVIGSGRNGQTYLFWDENQLFQLPVGYSTVVGRWINSPGYQDGTASFDRGIIPRCLECHAAYFESQFADPNSNFYNTKNFIVGISCERCHGPGRAHAEKLANGNAARLPAIVNPAKLSRKLQADICAQCHAGPGERELLPAFSYIPGQPLEKYLDLGPSDSAQEIDVHGKQVKLLMKSKCFQASPEMTCSTCHDLHKPEPDLATLSERCRNCHKAQATGEHAKMATASGKTCVDCHMPMLETKVVQLDVNGKTIRPRLRTHWIRVYSESDGP